MKTKEGELLPRGRKIQNSKTHLYHDHKNLKAIPQMNLSTACVIYLHNNAISQIENIQSSTLCALYLQCNNISEIKNLEEVKNLKKLYLGNNEICVLEGLNQLGQLEELHIEKQNLPMGTSLCFDPRSIMCISKSLKVLNISDNGIESLSGLMPLRHLTSLCASNNRLKDIEETCELLKFWFYLKNAWFQGNPISKKHRYREDIIASSYCLDFLDDKPVSPSSRNFIKCLENNKLKKSSRPSIDLTQIVASAPHNYPPPLKNAVSASLIHSQLHIFGPLDVPIKNPISIVRGKPRLKKKPPHNRLNKEDSHSFPALFAYGMGSAWK